MDGWSGEVVKAEKGGEREWETFKEIRPKGNLVSYRSCY